MHEGQTFARLTVRLALAGAISMGPFWAWGCGDGGKVDNPSGGGDGMPSFSLNLPGAPTEATEPTLLPPAPTGPTGPTYHLDSTLKLNEIQLKGSHNSYHIRPPNNDEAWHYDLPPLRDQLENFGVRAFELDLHYYGGRFPVFHLPDWDQRSTCYFLEDCLAEIREWSRANPGHAPLFVYFEFKDESDPLKVADHLEELEQILVDHYPRKMVFTPDDMTGKFPDVQSAMKANGWPKLGAVRGKTIFIMHAFGLAPHRYSFGSNGLWGRRMFTSSVEPNNRLTGFLALDEPVENEGNIRTKVANGFIVRTRADDLPTFGGDRWGKSKAALRSGAQVILTDYPEPWYIPDYHFFMPGGTPMRCNPITGPRTPGACTPEGIENPLLLVNPLYFAAPG